MVLDKILYKVVININYKWTARLPGVGQYHLQGGCGKQLHMEGARLHGVGQDPLQGHWHDH
eukprot:3206708-Prorocentrum_lima.AAC.1